MSLSQVSPYKATDVNCNGNVDTKPLKKESQKHVDYKADGFVSSTSQTKGSKVALNDDVITCTNGIATSIISYLKDVHLSNFAVRKSIEFKKDKDAQPQMTVWLKNGPSNAKFKVLKEAYKFKNGTAEFVQSSREVLLCKFAIDELRLKTIDFDSRVDNEARIFSIKSPTQMNSSFKVMNKHISCQDGVAGSIISNLSHLFFSNFIVNGEIKIPQTKSQLHNIQYVAEVSLLVANKATELHVNDNTLSCKGGSSSFVTTTLPRIQLNNHKINQELNLKTEDRQNLALVKATEASPECEFELVNDTLYCKNGSAETIHSDLPKVILTNFKVGKVIFNKHTQQKSEIESIATLILNDICQNAQLKIVGNMLYCKDGAAKHVFTDLSNVCLVDFKVEESVHFRKERSPTSPNLVAVLCKLESGCIVKSISGLSTNVSLSKEDEIKKE